MNQQPLKPQLHMRRSGLEGLPRLALPEGYSIRSYRPGDAARWSRLITESFGGEPEDWNFDRIMRPEVSFRPERMFFVCSGDEVVATASAFYRPAFMPGFGMLHYVAVLPEHAGRRLGFQVSLAALIRMHRDARGGAWLSTDDFRLPAIKTYLNLGFEPMLVHENQPERWREVFQCLGAPGLCKRFNALLSGPLWQAPVYPADDYDYERKVCVRRRRHPLRRPGRPHAVECDALGDESLYKASSLGSARSVPDTVIAGQTGALTICFTAGAAGLPEGSRGLFYAEGQKTLGDIKDDSVIQLQTAVERHAQLRVSGLGFQVERGELQKGDEVSLRVGGEHGICWTKLAGRKEIKTLIDPGECEPLMRLPEPLVINVLPLQPERVEILLPGTAAPGAAVRAVCSLRDRYDNLVPEDRGITAVLPGGEEPVVLRDGVACLDTTAPSSGTLRIAAHTGNPDCRGVSNPCLADKSRYRLFVGDLHVHDFTCPAEGRPADIYRRAREEKRLDFLSVAVQNHANLDNEKWVINKHMAETFLEEGRFVTFPAFEWQHSHYGDKIAHYLGGDQPYMPVDDRDFDHPSKLYEALRASDAIVISHHPGYALDLHVPGTDWEAVETDVERLTELWSMHGSSEGYDPEDRPLTGNRRPEGVMAALKAGLRLGLLAGSDTHSGRPGGSAREPRPYRGGLAALWAESLTRRGIFEALHARRTYALTGSRIVLKFMVNGAWMGSELPPADTADIEVDVRAQEDIEKIELLKDAETVQTVRPGDCEFQGSFRFNLSGAAFFHCRVTQSDGELAVCSPVWVG